ncbi:MAG: hypothetical protein H5T82_06255 [Demequina sp.]|uniref:hypothetical protein n=1 Tax=Demequina sp. TaxID=2050685 RepID=UPI0019B6CF8D|nr:hypothetical protein [Demequina sp.]MBC7298477.1 hypothetical protein [Demequina sp.]
MRTSPRKVGLLGGITWHSTLDHRRLIHQGVIAGCTEIPMAMTAQGVDAPYLNALALHARAAVTYARGD